MKTNALLLLILLAPSLVLGQKLSKDFKLTPSKPYQVVDAPSKRYFSVGNGHTISVKTRGEIVTIQRFNTDGMKEVSRKEYKDFPKYNKVQEIIQAGDKLYYISEAYAKKEKKFRVYAREIDTENGTFKDIKELLVTSRPATATKLGFGQSAGAFGFGGGVKFVATSSFDGSKILIQYRLKPKSRKDAENNDDLGFYVFDNAFNKVWGAEVSMPYTEKQMNNLAYCVTADGDAHMLAYLNETKSLEILTISDGELNATKLDVPSDIMFQKLDLKEDDMGNIVCAGYYATGIEFNFNFFGGGSLSFNTDGLCVFRIDDAGKVTDFHKHDFDLAFINEYKSARDKKKADKKEAKGKAGIPDLQMKEFRINEDGSMIIVGERAYARNEFMGPKQQMVWHYRNVVMTKLDAEGSILWQKKLPKSQAGTRGQGGMGIKYISGNGSHYVLFLDNIKNKSLPVGRAPVDHKDGMGGFLMAMKVNDATGDVERHALFDVRNIKGGIQAHQFATSRIFDISDTGMMLETYIKGKKDVMLKLELVSE